jgi:hypothetical protein
MIIRHGGNNGRYVGTRIRITKLWSRLNPRKRTFPKSRPGQLRRRVASRLQVCHCRELLRRNPAQTNPSPSASSCCGEEKQALSRGHSSDPTGAARRFPRLVLHKANSVVLNRKCHHPATFARARCLPARISCQRRAAVSSFPASR